MAFSGANRLGTLLKLRLSLFVLALVSTWVALTGLGGVGTDVAWLISGVSMVAFVMTLFA
jgi:hypothetical protein